MTSKKTILIFIISLTIILSIVFTIFSFIHEINRPKLPVLGNIKHFSLTDSAGEVFGSENLKNSIWVAQFFFTTCGDICPMISKNMASLNRTFEEIDGITLVSITVNPEHDTPQILSQYAQKLNAIKNKWYFLTGPREKIEEIVLGSFKLGSVEEPIFHSGKLVLVDRYGYIRGYYEGTQQEEVNKIFKDAIALLKER